MSEQLHHQAEKREHHPSPETTRQEKEHLEHLKHKAEQAEKHERQRRNIEHLKKQVESEAKGREDTLPAEGPEKKSEPFIGMQRELKAKAYKTTMRKVRSHLRPAERTFSKIIHQPLVDAVSEFGSKTVARPSAILGGGVAALIGSCFILFMAKYYGFEYNFFVYIAFLLGGFVAGVAAELFFHRIHHSKK